MSFLGFMAFLTTEEYVVSWGFSPLLFSPSISVLPQRENAFAVSSHLFQLCAASESHSGHALVSQSASRCQPQVPGLPLWHLGHVSEEACTDFFATDFLSVASVMALADPPAF
jgi:hypothetical protein